MDNCPDLWAPASCERHGVLITAPWPWRSDWGISDAHACGACAGSPLQGSGPHAISISPDEKTAVVSTYFIDCEKTYGEGKDAVGCNLHKAGSRKVHFFDIGEPG